MGGFVKEMLHATKNYFNDGNENHYQECLDNEEKVDYYNHVIHTTTCLKFALKAWNGKVVISQAVLMDALQDLERIADHCVNLVEFFKSRYEMQAERLQNFTDSINHFLDRVTEQVEDTIFCFEKEDKGSCEKGCAGGGRNRQTKRKYRQAQLANIGSGVESRRMSSMRTFFQIWNASATIATTSPET